MSKMESNMNMCKHSYRLTVQATSSTYVSCSHVAFYSFSVFCHRFVFFLSLLCAFRLGPSACVLLRSPPTTSNCGSSHSCRPSTAAVREQKWAANNCVLDCFITHFTFDVCVLFCFSSVLSCLLLLLSVGDFKQPFEISVELKGVMQDASVIQINKAQPKSRMLHCASVSVKPQDGHPFLFFIVSVVLDMISEESFNSFTPAHHNVKWSFFLYLKV